MDVTHFVDFYDDRLSSRGCLSRKVSGWQWFHYSVQGKKLFVWEVNLRCLIKAILQRIMTSARQV